MEAKSPFEEIFSSEDKKKKVEEEKEKDILDFSDSQNKTSPPLETGNRYINLVVELLQGKYFYEAIEVIREMAGEGL